MIVCLFSSFWVGWALILVGIIGIGCFTATDPFTILNNILWTNSNSFTMLAVPLFVLMGEILFRSKISANLFKGLSPIMAKLPGKLIHINIVASALFAAVCGSSAATTTTVGKITLPELSKRGYDEGLSLGTLAGAGTLGFLIPPSTMMMVYGMLANVSIGDLFVAGVLPGILIAVCMMGYVIIRCLLNPRLTPQNETFSKKEMLQSMPLILPVVILIVVVLGSIYGGYATPTEAAALGVLGSLLFAIATRSITVKQFFEAMKGTIVTSAMILIIVTGAAYLSVAMGYLNIPNSLTALIVELGVGPYALIAILTVLYLILGCMLEGFSMIVMTLPLALPLIKNAGFDPLWFGIYLVIMIQLAQLTPPVGFNLFVISGLTGKDVLQIARHVLPYFIIMLAIVAVITIFPDFVLYIPKHMMGGG